MGYVGQDAKCEQYEDTMNTENISNIVFKCFDSELYLTVHLWESVLKYTLRYVPSSGEFISVENERDSVELLSCQQERLIFHITLQSIHQ